MLPAVQHPRLGSIAGRIEPCVLPRTLALVLVVGEEEEDLSLSLSGLKQQEAPFLNQCFSERKMWACISIFVE